MCDFWYRYEAKKKVLKKNVLFCDCDKCIFGVVFAILKKYYAN